MKKRTIVMLAGTLFLLMLYSFKAKQKFNEYTNSNGDTVLVLDSGESIEVDGVLYYNNNPAPFVEKYVLCPGDGQTCAGTITLVSGIKIDYNEYKGEGKPNIEKIDDPK
jgi:hypothetical protein